jgi:hypothetical protein
MAKNLLGLDMFLKFYEVCGQGVMECSRVGFVSSLLLFFECYCLEC